ncbi:glycosyltransferase [Microlunatus ginsengisoli]
MTSVVSDSSAGAVREAAVSASIIIPANNEAAVVGRLLSALAPGAREGRWQLIVACNGCSDDTAEVARSYAGVEVIEIAHGSKAGALNAGDAVAVAGVRIYLDADVEISPGSVDTVISALDGSGALAGRPALRYNTDGATAPVRAFYRARQRTGITAKHLWGAGVYGTSAAGRSRFDKFPSITADDLYIDTLFSADEKVVLNVEPVLVRTPRSTAQLVAVLRRTYRGNREVTALLGTAEQSGSSADSFRQLISACRRPGDVVDAAVYAAMVTVARVGGRRATVWERDDSSRQMVAPHIAKSAARPISDPRPTADHILLTRFNLPSTGVERLVRAQDNWLRDRVALFETYTVPSVRAQTLRRFEWFVYFDPESPEWLMEWIAPYEREGLFKPIFRETVSAADIMADAGRLLDRRHRDVITTNVDNDDGLAVDFVELLHRASARGPRTAIYLSNGLILSPKGLYLRKDRVNAFCSVRESWDALQTCWSNWHNLLPESMPAVHLGGAPAWLQVVHDTNVSNRVRGRLVCPGPFVSRFGTLVENAPHPDRGALARDRLVDGPTRFGRELCRGAIKRMIMVIGGKDGLDRVKSMLAVRRRSQEASQ